MTVPGKKGNHNRKSQTRRMTPNTANSGCQEGRVPSDVTIQDTDLKEGLQGRVAPQDIQSWIKTHVAKHKWLAGGVAFVNEIPKSASGKILRKIMCEWAKKDVPLLEKRIKARL